MNWFTRQAKLWELHNQYKGNLRNAKDYVAEARTARAEGDSELMWDALACAHRSRATALKAWQRYCTLSAAIPGRAYT